MSNTDSRYAKDHDSVAVDAVLIVDREGDQPDRDKPDGLAQAMGLLSWPIPISVEVRLIPAEKMKG